MSPAVSAPTLAPAPTVRIIDTELLSDNWYTLRKITFDFQRRDGSWQRLSREAYDRGNGAVLLLFNALRGTVIVTRQFRLPAFVNGSADGMLIEACAGLLDGDDPEACIRREVQEETGFQIESPRKIFEAYMSPGSVTEKLHFYVAQYDSHQQVGAGGGLAHEGEDIEVLELPLTTAMAMVQSGEIQDGKTIMLLQYAALHGLAQLSTTSETRHALPPAPHAG